MTWEIATPLSHKKFRVVHGNMLRPWHTSATTVNRVVVMSEYDDPVPDSEPTPSCSLTPEQVVSLASLKSQFSHILTDNPGCTTVLEMSIDTGDALPFQSYPYRLPVQLVQPVKDALDLLLSKGIIEPCSGPWSSPMLPVKKRDGSVRICIDFRRLMP